MFPAVVVMVGSSLRTEEGAAEEIRDFAGRYDPQPFHLDETGAADTFFRGLTASAPPRPGPAGQPVLRRPAATPLMVMSRARCSPSSASWPSASCSRIRRSSSTCR